NRAAPMAINANVVDALQQLWLNDIPSKVNIFGWRLLLAKLPTRMALVRKGIIVNPRESCCAFCFREAEDIDHLFFNCPFSNQVWTKIYKWLNVEFIPFDESWKHFVTFGLLVTNKKYAKGRHVIWLATTWSLWRLRNHIMFRGDLANLSSLVDQITYIS
ncbi:putative ribonuclease H protein, partial [Trifolium medium]|nr:putative ribonuclease H protein [Trifolium medium]